MNQRSEALERVGRIVGDARTNTREFRIILDDTSYLAVDDLVVVISESRA